MTLTKIKQNNWLCGLKISAALSLLLLITMPVLVHAENVVEGFSSKQTLEPGEVVALDKSASRTVKAAPAINANLMYGVMVDPSDAPITLVGQNASVFVATTGTYQVLVTSAFGGIKAGDFVSMSATDGIAAKAKSIEPMVLGKAISPFDGKTGVISNSGGLTLGRIYVNINIQKNPIVNSDPTLPYYLQKISNSVANKSVPVIRVYTALLIFFIAIVAAITILFSGVKSSLISLGRNPLSRRVIFRGMYRAVFTGIGVSIIGLAGVYLLLKA